MNKSYHMCQAAPKETSELVEIGEQAVWILSSAKLGNGVDQLRDNDTATFWQSDGTIPHLINIQFMKKTRVSQIAMYLDFKSDESYTPNKISIKGGLNLQDLKEISLVELKEPQEWFIFPLKAKLTDGGEKYSQKNKNHRPYVYTMNIQIVILQNHHMGKDTHIRQIKIYGPREYPYNFPVKELVLGITMETMSINSNRMMSPVMSS
jgi:anaphase-promoting complex subunit 10